ncbi:MAG: hypothetical protein H0X24_08215 [Ktedonobacterales bacterium]|nr:hypothetical protein [Ktedonobacterales bacterium]
MLASDSDSPTRHIALPVDLSIMNPATTWGRLSGEEQGRFLLVAMKTLNHRPLPDPNWHGLQSMGLTCVVGGHLVLAPAGVFLMQHIIETEFAWLTEWI